MDFLKKGLLILSYVLLIGLGILTYYTLRWYRIKHEPIKEAFVVDERVIPNDSLFYEVGKQYYYRYEVFTQYTSGSFPVIKKKKWKEFRGMIVKDSGKLVHKPF